jgi:hemerythrin-like domain-containing protein
MKPIGPLMWEHRLIEKMVHIFNREIARITENNTVNTVLVVSAVDFFRTYADRTHHGKEEDILFRDLAGKKLLSEHDRIMKELVEEHIYARKTVGALLVANAKYVKGNVHEAQEILKCLKALSELYPKHIEKEDRRFFFPILDYFTRQEQDAMLQEFWEFDRNMIHEKYKKVVDEYEKEK